MSDLQVHESQLIGSSGVDERDGLVTGTWMMVVLWTRAAADGFMVCCGSMGYTPPVRWLHASLLPMLLGASKTAVKRPANVKLAVQYYHVVHAGAEHA